MIYIFYKLINVQVVKSELEQFVPKVGLYRRTSEHSVRTLHVPDSLCSLI